MTTHATRTTRTTPSPQPARGNDSAHWLGYAALSGWLAGPLLTTGYWLVSGDADGEQLTFRPAAGLLPLTGLLLVWAAFAWTTHGTLASGWRIAAWRATIVLALGSVGWGLAYFLPLPTGGSINALVVEWAGLTLPYPAVAAAVYVLAVRHPTISGPEPRNLPHARRPHTAAPTTPTQPGANVPTTPEPVADLAL